MEDFTKNLASWNNKTPSFVKLQHAYLVVAFAALIIAGVIGLVNYRLGQSILFLALFAGVIFLANGVLWALIRTFVIREPKPKTSTRKK